MSVLDLHGHPVSTRRLMGLQSAALGSVRTTRAEGPGDLSPTQLAALLEEAVQGDLTRQAALFREMEERDAHLFAELSKRKRALLTLAWSVTPPRDPTPEESEAAAALQAWLQELPDLEDLILALADAIGKGFSCVELEWAPPTPGGLLAVRRFHHRPQEWFTVDKEDPEALQLRTEGGQGEALRPLGWLVHVHKASSGYPAEAALARVLAWPYLYKRWALSDFARYLEVHGLPFRLGRFPMGATESERTALLRAVTNLGHDAAAVIPDTMMIEFQEAARGNGETFLAMLSWADQAMSKAILGGTLTSQADGKSSTHALGVVHNEVRHDLLIADATQIAGALTRDLIHPLTALNFAARVRPGRFTFDTRPVADLTPYASSLPALAALFPIPVGWVRERLGIPAPRAGEEVVGAGEMDRPNQASLRNEPATALAQHGCENWRTLHDDKGKPYPWCVDNAVAETISDLESYSKKKKHLGESRECVSLVKFYFRHLGQTSNWVPAKKVSQLDNFDLGTKAIPVAIFDQAGTYANKSGKSHAVIMVGKNDVGIWGYDQWAGGDGEGYVSLRFYRFGDESKVYKNARNYSVITRRERKK